MKYIQYIVLASLLSCISVYAQYTQIPDPGFEYVLIDLGIDSEGVLDGRILTNDILYLEELDMSNANLPYNHSTYNLIGLENFMSLKDLHVYNLYLYFEELNLSILPNLEKFTLTSGNDHIDSELIHVLLTNNPNLKEINVSSDLLIESIDLRASDLEIDYIKIDFTPGSFPDRPTSYSRQGKLCVKVTDPLAATNKTGVYTNWIDYDSVYYTTEDCSLSVEDYELSVFKVYPNPSQDFFQVETSQDITSLSLYDISGKEVKVYNQMQDAYDISDLSPGVYMLKIKLETGELMKKKLIIE